VPHLPEGTTLLDLCDWERMCETVAALAPLWEPGARSGYHGLTFGWILGEVVRRASGRRIDQIVREEIAAPLGVADSLALGISDAMRSRMAVHHDDGLGASTAPLDIPLATYPFPYSTGANDHRFLGSCVPAGATASARGLARMYAALANGGELDGVTLMSREHVASIAAVAVDGVDEVLGRPIQRGLGYVLGRPGTPMGHGASFGHSGTGESIAFADPQRHFAFALTKSNLTQPGAAHSTVDTVVGEVRAALGLPPSGTG
jgi:CubicO group peptidase (beta-lactamase class C family)